ncbi:unnamed protein product [Onchocerca flexuosa]|uniref:Uncharacterized protein n=1 Tax=Onchocerca flexuosa TaxID=387005 RepID=A0A183I3A9_9BILA|nr:unnamed protein product [Onchocerca flexuosa]
MQLLSRSDFVISRQMYNKQVICRVLRIVNSRKSLDFAIVQEKYAPVVELYIVQIWREDNKKIDGMGRTLSGKTTRTVGS